jgi:hypothetical protein
MSAFGFKAVLFTIFEYDYDAQDKFLDSSVYRAYGDMQIQSHLSRAKKEYMDLKTAKAKGSGN